EILFTHATPPCTQLPTKRMFSKARARASVARCRSTISRSCGLGDTCLVLGRGGGWGRRGRGCRGTRSGRRGSGRRALRGSRFQLVEAMQQECRAVARYHLCCLGLLGAVALSDLLGPALLGGFPELGRNLRRINQPLRESRSCERQRHQGRADDGFQIRLL